MVICFMSVDTSSAISILLNVNNDSMLKTINNVSFRAEHEKLTRNSTCLLELKEGLRLVFST